MKKNILTELFSSILLAGISVIITSCRGSDNSNQMQTINGKANITVSLVGIETETTDNNELDMQASSGKANPVKSLEIQNQIIPLDNDLSLVATLSPDLNNIKNKILASATPVAGTPTNLNSGVMYKVVVYDDTGNYVTEKNYITGQVPESLSLDDGKTYTFIAYSVNKSNTVPSVNNGGTLNTATLTDVKDDLMYFKASKQVFAKQTNNLNIVLKHQFAQVTTKLDASSVGNISNISGVTMKPSASSVDLKFSNNSLNYKNTGAGTSVDFPNKGSNTISSKPTIVFSPSTEAGQFNISSITINNTTKSNITFSNLKITSGAKYNMNLTLRGPAQVTGCGAGIPWPTNSNVIKLPYGGGNGGIFPGYSGDFRSNYSWGIDGVNYKATIDRTILQNGNGELILNLTRVSGGPSAYTENGTLTINIGNKRCTYNISKSSTSIIPYFT